MKNLLLLRITPLLIVFLIYGCDSETNTATSAENSGKSSAEEAREAFDSNWALFNHEDLADSLTFNRFLSFFDDDFQMMGDKGKLPDDGSGMFNWLRGYVKTNKPRFDVSVDTVEASEGLAYVLYRYHETFTEIETGNMTIDVMHSAVMVLRKNEKGQWKCALLKFT